jgi:hypothetical protein
VKAIQVTEKNLGEISRAVSKAYLRDLRRRLKIANKLETQLFFIPYYMYPAYGDIPRNFIVSGEYLMKYFGPIDYDPFSEWLKLIPKQETYSREQKPAKNVQSNLESVPKQKRPSSGKQWADIFESASLSRRRGA